jgi:tetratricopeptide (TPR) repeat protein
MNKNLVLTLALIASIVILTLAGDAHADSAKPQDTAAKLGYVQRLLTDSSAAEKVEQSGNAQALEMKAEAQAHFDRASELHAAGDADAAEAELRESIRLLTEAARTAQGESAVTPKQSNDYGQRRDSVEALAMAHDRIATEKGLDDMNRELQAKVANDLSASDALLEAGKGGEARSMLDATYETVKSSLETLRGGDTLVRELNFETKEDEYLYELDRNDTHQMLVQVLFAEKMASSPMRATAEGFIETAATLRTEAETAAAKKNYEEAIELLENSTKELIRAIRSAGVYIPG